jgi:hypothetical protein
LIRRRIGLSSRRTRTRSMRLLSRRPEGHLLFFRDEASSRSVSIRRLRTAGQMLPIAQRIASYTLFLEGGDLLRRRERDDRLRPGGELIDALWFDRNGRTLGTVGEPRCSLPRPSGTRKTSDLSGWTAARRDSTRSLDPRLRHLALRSCPRSPQSVYVGTLEQCLPGLVSGREPHRLRHGPQSPGRSL